MTTKLHRWFEKFERQKTEILSGVAAMPPARLQFRETAHSWSALQVLDHLVKVEEVWLEAVMKNASPGHQVTPKARFAGLIATCVMLLPTRVKVPSGAQAVVPDTTLELPLISARWAKIRCQISDSFQDFPIHRLGVLPHPITGWMTLDRATSFLSAHLRHHRYQLSRLQRASREI
ncbi:MAG: DinB family protein [Candidatus Acidiferrum sp.]